MVFFYGPLYLEVICSSFCLRSTGLLLFREMTPGMVSVFSTLLGSTADTCSASVYEAFLEELHTFSSGYDCILWTGADAGPFGPSVQKIIEILLLYIDKVIDGVVMQVQQIPALLWETTSGFCSRIQRYLVRQWIHVSVSLRRRGACWLRCT